MFRKVIFVFLILINTSCYAFIENNRLFSQTVAESEERGYEARKTGVYAEVDAALSVKSSREFASAAEFEKKSNVLHVGVNYFQPPFIMRSSNDGYYGFDVSMMLFICKSLNRTCNFHSMRFDELLSSVESGKIDVAASSITITYERSKKVNFSNPYLISTSRFLGLIKFKNQNMSSDFISGKKIGIKQGSIFDEQLKDLNLKQITIYKFTDDNLLIDALSQKMVDLILTDNETAIYWANHSSDKFAVIGKPIEYGFGYGVATNLLDLELNKQINICLEAYHNSNNFKRDFDSYIKEF